MKLNKSGFVASSVSLMGLNDLEKGAHVEL